MHSRISIAFLCLFSALSFAQPKVASGSLKHFENFESKFVTPRTVDIWTPDGYNDKEKYSVIYMHDGQMLFDGDQTWNKQAWEADDTAAKLIAARETKKFIIVAIYNIGEYRMSDYFPQKPFEALTQKSRDSIYDLYMGEKPMWSAKVSSDNYLKFIVTELKPFIDKTYSVNTDAANTFIAGSSMGGLISLYAICEYPQVFGGAACLSTHWTGVFGTAQNPVPAQFISYLKKKLPAPATHKIYFDLGSEGIDANYGTTQKKVDAIMTQKGYTTKNWMTKEFPGDDHSEKSWAARLAQPLIFLMGDPSKPQTPTLVKAADDKPKDMSKQRPVKKEEPKK
ncbi:MAG: alpha/beta hydrolase [Flavobacterium sp.]|uniref:alpha/beta hydrolase n=1 Tax=Flavobacterium sp. TaxID=239 RepID=UPI001226C435|nr:alpha/beta hydrolase-fold protein [Flavobacterium sp.]RZJ65777.1 MAG: alpha/beta hydrolase [Flavobacterium sp.]